MAYLFFSANFTLVFEEWLWSLEYPFKYYSRDVLIDRTEKESEWYIYQQFLAHEYPKIACKNTQKIYKTSNQFYILLLLRDDYHNNMWLSLCLLTVLVLQGIVVKCTLVQLIAD